MDKKKRKGAAMVPLEAQLEDDKAVKPKLRKTQKQKKLQDEEEEAIPRAMSNKILGAARSQMEEIEQEESGVPERSSARFVGNTKLNAAAYHASDSEGEEDDFSDTEDFEGEADITEEDAALIERFMNPNAQEPRTLSDLIMERIRDAETSGTPAPTDEMEGDGIIAPVPGVDEKVQEVYTEVGRLLTRYRGGKVPKAFKIIPSLNNWEEVLYITAPDQWTPHAMYQATRLFASNLNPKMAQRFFNLVLLPACRADIKRNKRLHFALFQALKKSVYKPGAFYKGLLLPLCASGTCTVREAVIWSSLLARVSIPVLHSSVAIMKIAEMPYTGVNSFFLSQLLNKKYALPHRVIDTLVEHFAKFESEDRALPVVWHQALLTFIQRYQFDIRAEDKQRLKAAIRNHHHYLMTSEIKRELGQGLSRGEKPAADTSMKILDPMTLGSTSRENPRELPAVVMDESI
eukprot:1180650-Prorocentrum_minimum.AAC.2